MKTINLELSQKLAPYLEDVKTEYGYRYIYDFISDTELSSTPFGGYIINIEECILNNDKYDIKTLTLEEAIDFLPISIPLYKTLYSVTYGTNGQIFNGVKTYYTQLSTSGYRIEKRNEGKTLLEAIEKMLEYLLDNVMIVNG